MDFKKLKDIAKTAVDKTAEGLDKANEMRKKASLETKITLPATNQFTSSTTIRKTVDGQYYIGLYSEEPVLYEFENFSFSGSTIIERTTTTGKTKQKGRVGSTLLGGTIGAAINPVGAVIGAMAGGARAKNGTINSTSVTTQEEKPGSASVLLRNITTGEIKTISTKLTQAQANNVERFFD
ncbi:hypothetical protein NMM18_05055 [Streptococcus oralis]|uniref:hypothetical protein n=1 Tax=Streptococcus oralis TaxID=1303 RepID=UPI0020C9273D|nr:hypothetical protein [Streptococcus oralis]MCP9037457.1 hypothetical protein [Streptococcus oralis]MCP9052912.1 hypothetical protein [Streptococcus oralis]MCP9057943.1 hypothetical protein [Streptococcus oralis]MCP9065176.1 hypothetical protein [Streptococcus oralis]MCP9069737.1 hypothetical protein [Streptococcus oralis]